MQTASAATIKAHLDTLRQQHLFMTPPPLAPLQQRVNSELAPAQLSGDNTKLQAAHDALTRAQADHEAKRQLQEQIAILEVDYNNTVDAEHRAKRDRLNAELDTARAIIHEHATLAAVAFHDAAMLCKQLGINPYQALGAFDCATLRPASWQGTVSDILLQPNGMLPSVRHALDERAARADARAERKQAQALKVA